MATVTTSGLRKLGLQKLEAGGWAVLDSDGVPVGFLDYKTVTDSVSRYAEGLARMSEVVRDAPGASVDAEVKRATVRLMAETGLDFGKAMSRVLALNPSLKSRYRSAHQQVLRG